MFVKSPYTFYQIGKYASFYSSQMFLNMCFKHNLKQFFAVKLILQYSGKIYLLNKDTVLEFKDFKVMSKINLSGDIGIFPISISCNDYLVS